MLIALDTALRRQRRRVLTVVATLALAGAVVGAHTLMADEHIGDGSVMCLAIVSTAAVAAGIAIAVAGLVRHRPLEAAFPLAVAPIQSARDGVRARAGPSLLQVFRL